MARDEIVATEQQRGMLQLKIAAKRYLDGDIDGKRFMVEFNSTISAFPSVVTPMANAIIRAKYEEPVGAAANRA